MGFYYNPPYLLFGEKMSVEARVLGQVGDGTIDKQTLTTSWSELRAGTLGNRNVIGLQNNSDKIIYLNYSTDKDGTNSWQLGIGDNIFIQIDVIVKLYGMVATGTADVIIWEQM